MPTLQALGSHYRWSAGRTQQPLVNFNEIKTCPALCLGILFSYSSVWVSECVGVCVCVCAASVIQHSQNNVMYKGRISNLTSQHLYSSDLSEQTSPLSVFVLDVVLVWMVWNWAMFVSQKTLMADVLQIPLCIRMNNKTCAHLWGECSLHVSVC